MTKLCLDCGEEKSLDSFYKNPRAGALGRNAYCIPCAKIRMHRYYCRSQYGMTHEEVVALRDAPSNCAICDVAFDGSVRRVLDHNHDGGAVRGVICDKCNTGLGLFQDNPERLERAKIYLLSFS